MAAQPDISQILAALGAAQANGAPQQHQQQAPPPQQLPPPGYPQAHAAQPQTALPLGVSYLPSPSTTGSVDLSAIKPVNSGSVSIADAIAKARSIAADRGVSSYDSRSSAAAAPRKDPRLAARGDDRSYQRSRSRSPPRRESHNATTNPYREERRDDNRRNGSHRRSVSPDRNFRGSRDPPAGYRANDGETETIRVKSSLVGLIIGRNGENLRKVETESGARVQFIQAKDSHSTERQCTISGPTRARELAKTAIFSIIDDGQGSSNLNPDKGGYTAGMPGRAKVNLPALREGEASTQIMVPDKTVGLIIGRGGETIKDLQERSGCHVNIVGENKSMNGLRPVNLIGSVSATALAKELILEIVESDSRGSGSNAQPPARDRGFGGDSYGGRGAGGARGGGDSVDKTIHVPSEAVGMIIGKGGETIKDMQRTTGCKINVNQPTRPDVERQIDLSGPPGALAEAERIIWEKVETVRERDATGGGGRGRGGGGRDQGNNGYSQQQPSSGYGGGYSGQQYASQQPQAPPQMPAFQMPSATQYQAAAQPAGDQSGNDLQAQWAQWYAAAMQQQGQQGGNPGAGTQ